MTWLLDTCVLSEYCRPRPDARVVAWLDAQPESTLFLSALSLAEIDQGIAKLTLRQGSAGDAARVARLTTWLGTVTERFADRTLPVEAAIWRVWAQLTASAEADGQRIPSMDGLLMATAQCHGLTVVTRNVADFCRYPHVFNPWTDA